MPPRTTISSQTDDDEEYLKVLKAKEEALRIADSKQQEAMPKPQPSTHEPTKGEQERDTAIFYNKYICLVFGADVFGYK